MCTDQITGVPKYIVGICLWIFSWTERNPMKYDCGDILVVSAPSTLCLVSNAGRHFY